MQSMTKLILDCPFPGEFPIATHALASAVAEELTAAVSPQHEVIVKPSSDRAFDATIAVQENQIPKKYAKNN
jgi:hypothetical protein